MTSVDCRGRLQAMPSDSRGAGWWCGAVVGAVENRGVENGGNDRTEGFYRVKRSGLAKVSNLY